MPFQATFVHGDPRMVDHTPSAAVSAGDVVVIGSNVRIAHRDIAADELGALGAGDGVYDFAKDDASGSGWSDGDLIYWDDTANEATTTVGSNKKIGPAIGDAADSDTTGRVFHVAQAV